MEILLREYLMDYGFSNLLAKIGAYIIFALIIILLCFIANLIAKKIILKLIVKYIKVSKCRWDDYLLKRKVFHNLFRIIPAIIIYATAPLFGKFEVYIQRICIGYLIIITMFIMSSVLDAVNDFYTTLPISKVRPIKSLLQVIKIATYVVLGIVLIASLTGESPFLMLSGIGALSAVFSLVFKDSILGFVAGIQLTSNDLLRIGDWIEVPSHGADGDVIDISLNTIRVRNFDNTIITLPAYALISGSFRNWRGMQESGGRRIKRSIYIDTSSIKFCTPEMLERFKKIRYLKEYISNKEIEINEYNQKMDADKEQLVNGRHLTNIGTFRAYIEHYLKEHPMVHKGLIYMVRQHESGERGLPLELYMFVTETNWVAYENIQSDIFDHIYAVASEFELRIFQNPSGHDMRYFVQEKHEEI